MWLISLHHQFPSPLEGTRASKQPTAARLYLPISRHFSAALTHPCLSPVLFTLPNGEPGVIILFAFVIFFYEERTPDWQPVCWLNTNTKTGKVRQVTESYSWNTRDYRASRNQPSIEQKAPLLVTKTYLIHWNFWGKRGRYLNYPLCWSSYTDHSCIPWLFEIQVKIIWQLFRLNSPWELGLAERCPSGWGLRWFSPAWEMWCQQQHGRDGQVLHENKTLRD